MINMILKITGEEDDENEVMNMMDGVKFKRRSIYCFDFI
jgi:hypothetical protein